MGDPISHHEIDLKKANSHGYRNNANAAGIPIIGLSHVTQKGQTNEDFHCGVCQVPFRFKGRVSHLSSTEHRRICMVRKYNSRNTSLTRGYILSHYQFSLDYRQVTTDE